MTTTAVPPYRRGPVLAAGRITNRKLHANVLGIAIIREQLHNGDVMVEGRSGLSIVRHRTELETPVRPGVPLMPPTTAPMRATAGRHRIVEPTAVRIITGMQSRRRQGGQR